MPFFLYCVSKSRRSNIDVHKKGQFQEAAKHVLALTDKQLAELPRRGDFAEVKSE